MDLWILNPSTDFTFLQHEVCSDYFIHQHIHDIESFDLFGMKVQVTQYHTYFSVNPPLHRTFTAFDT